MYMEPDDLGSSAALRWPEPDPPDQDADGTANAEAAVAALYRAQAVGLIRLAYLMLGDRGAAEDVVQDAFCGLYWHWDRLADPAGALAYVRSPDGTQLAAAIGDSVLYAEHLYVFDLATGTKRAWTTRTCSQCVPTSGGMLYFGVNTDALSWTADSQHVAFIWDNTLRLLDTRAAGTGILTDSKTVATWTGGVTGLNQWRGAIITPDGRTVLGIEELSRIGLNAPVREHLVRWSTATGRQTAVLNNLNARELDDFEQILYTSDDGSVLVLTYQQPGTNATIVHDGRSTPIPWSPHIAVAAW